MPTTQKMPPAYSPALDLANPTGRNPTTVTSVPVSIGNAVLLHANVAAATRSYPSSIFTTIISTAMMASSTSRPRARISAPRLMRSRLIPAAFITTSVDRRGRAGRSAPPRRRSASRARGS